MPKLNAAKKVTVVNMHEANLADYPNPEYDHEKDAQKAEQAMRGEFGTKIQLKAKIDDVQEKYPGLHITHRHNGTVR